MSAELLLIVPTRGRPANTAALHRAWRDTTTAGCSDLLLAVDDDDPALGAYRAVHQTMPEVTLRTGPRLRLVGTLNAVATEQAPHYHCLGFLGDDHRPRTASFDQRLVECLTGTGIAYGNDLLQGENMPTAVAMTSDIVQALGYFCPPSLQHLCADLVWLEWGKAIGRLTYLPDTIIEHLHPANGKAAMDPGYAEANSAEQVYRDHAAYDEYMAGQFHTDVEKLQALL